MKPFLTAKWKNLINITYKVPPEILLPVVPKGVELDVQDGYAFASVVAFEFLDTKVKGIRIPFHINFPEINLRYYLKYKGKRGVAFIKEFVPKLMIAKTANWIYNEPYSAIPMKVLKEESEATIQFVHEFFINGKKQFIKAKVGKVQSLPSEDTIAHYFKEHDTGFGQTHSGKTLQYEVRHPKWEVFELKDYEVNMDFEQVYGAKWGILHEAEVHCAIVAVGSPIEVYPAQALG